MSGKGTAVSRYRSQRTADPARTFFEDDKCRNVEAAGISKNKNDASYTSVKNIFKIKEMWKERLPH